MLLKDKLAVVNANLETATRASEFVACAKSLLAARGNAGDAARFAESNGFSDRVIRFVKGAVTAGSTAGVGWAQELVQYRQVADAFLSSLAPYSSFDKILNANGFVRLPMETRIVVTSTAATGTTAAEAEQKPVTQLQFSASNLVARKAVAIVVVSDEIALSANQAAFNLIGTELRKAVGIASDSTFLSVVSETTGVASSSSSGTTLDAFVADFNAALAAIEIGSTSKVYLIAPPGVVKAVAMMRGTAGAPAFPGLGIQGGDIAGVTVVPSNALSDSIVMLDATGVAVDSLPIVLDASTEASVQLTDTPTDGATQRTSLWQSNLRAVRAERQFACQLLRTDAVAVITDVAVSA